MEVEAATRGGSTSTDEETNRRPSLNSLTLMRKATTPADISSVDMKDWHHVVYEGVLLKNDTQKFWVDKELLKNCFLVLPKACDFAGADEESCWSWITKEEKCFRSTIDIPIPKSNKLSLFLIRGRFETRVLSPNTMYEVAFVVQLIRSHYRPSFHPKMNLDLPDGTKQEHWEPMENLVGKPEYEWINLRAGEFVMGPKTVGTINFALQWRLNPEMLGLMFKGVRIHPKD